MVPLQWSKWDRRDGGALTIRIFPPKILMTFLVIIVFLGHRRLFVTSFLHYFSYILAPLLLSPSHRAHLAATIHVAERRSGGTVLRCAAPYFDPESSLHLILFFYLITSSFVSPSIKPFSILKSRSSLLSSANHAYDLPDLSVRGPQNMTNPSFVFYALSSFFYSDKNVIQHFLPHSHFEGFNLCYCPTFCSTCILSTAKRK